MAREGTVTFVAMVNGREGAKEGLEKSSFVVCPRWSVESNETIGSGKQDKKFAWAVEKSSACKGRVGQWRSAPGPTLPIRNSSPSVPQCAVTVGDISADVQALRVTGYQL